MKKCWIIVSCLVIAMSGVFGQNQPFWSDVPGAQGGSTVLTATADGSIYAGLGYTLFRSTDNGNHWNRIPNPNLDTFPTGYRPTIIGRAGNLYKRARYGGLTHYHHSTDGGNSWSPFFQSDSILHLAELADGTLIGIDSHAVYRSTDQAQHWQQVAGNDTLTTRDYYWIFPNGDIWVSCNTNMYLWGRNSGTEWTVVKVPQHLNKLVTSKGHIFTWLKGNDALRSTDGGLQFEPIHIDSFATNQGGGLMLEVNAGKLLYFSRGGNYSSTDDGVHWQKLPTGFLKSPGSYPIFLPSVNTILLNVASLESLFRSTDEGLSWQYSSEGLRVGARLHFVSPDTVFCGNYSSLQRSFDAGQTWEQLTPFGNIGIAHQMEFIDQRDSFLVLGRDSAEAFYLFLSPDQGNSFQPIPIPNEPIYSFYFNPANRQIFCPDASYRKIFFSSDWGQNWQTAGIQLPDSMTFIADIAFHPSGRIYVSTYHDAAFPIFTSRLYYSDDAAASWNLLLTKSGDLSVGNLHIRPDGKIYFSFDKHLYISDDNGSSWLNRQVPWNNTNLSIPFPDGLISNLAGKLYANDGKIIYQSDDGIGWRQLPPIDTISDGWAKDFFISPDQRLYVVSRYFTFRSEPLLNGQGLLSGTVRVDDDADCVTPDGQTGLRSWVLEAIGPSHFYTTTDSTGRYSMAIDSGTYEVMVLPDNALWWSTCANDPFADIGYPAYSDSVAFTAIAASDCPLMSVDVTLPQLRRCFNNPVVIRYCNQGAATAAPAFIDLELDTYLTLINSDLPYDSLSPSNYRFNIGEVPPGHCDQFALTVLVNCDNTVLGQTHCITAHALPDTLCTDLPNWSGAQIEARASCQDSAVQLELRNTGVAASQLLDYIIIEDDVVLMNAQEQYDSGEVKILSFPANGHTWRIESEQEPGHPFSTQAIAFNEGCGGFASLGYVNQFSVNAWLPSISRDCRQNTGSYDPNDKQGFPLGTGSEHVIRPGQDLEYLIRFQNTGTDTAFTVVVRDTLSPWLDPASVRPGAASHPYTWTLNGPGVLAFTFDNIFLPDSNVNEAASHGFVSFRVAQQANVPLGVEIQNTAAIYFDFNAPVVTNQTRHTVGVLPVSGAFEPPVRPVPSEIRVTPQPAVSFTQIQRADGRPFHRHRLYLSDAWGRPVGEMELNGQAARMERGQLDAGVYYFKITDTNGQAAGGGRLIFLP